MGKQLLAFGNWPQVYYKLVWAIVALLDTTISQNIKQGRSKTTTKQEKKEMAETHKIPNLPFH